MMRKNFIRLLPIYVILFGVLTSCQKTLVYPIFGNISTDYLTFKHDGLEREYALHIPPHVGKNAPLLISMHGYTDDAKRHRNYTKLNQVANKYRFIVAYPRGTKDQYGKRFFNMGYFFHQQETVDDVGFLTELTQYLQKTYHINTERTFTSGFFNGGDMSYMLACQRPDIFKGFVSIGGLMLEDFKENCAFTTPIPMLEIRGEADKITLYEGDINNNIHLSKRRLIFGRPEMAVKQSVRILFLRQIPKKSTKSKLQNFSIAQIIKKSGCTKSRIMDINFRREQTAFISMPVKKSGNF